MASLFTLDLSGFIFAIAFGILVFIFGLGLWWFFIGVLIDFLVLSAIATRAKEEEKMHLKGYEKVRRWKNVVANGLVPLIIVFIYFINVDASLAAPGVILFSFVASMCAITADKFASEFGVLDGEPITLLTLKKSKKGRSGAVTWFGTLMGGVASVLIALTVFAIGGSLIIFIIVVIAGIVGNLVDSFFGYFEELGYGNKYTTNLLCSIGGALFCAAILLYIPSLL